MCSSKSQSSTDNRDRRGERRRKVDLLVNRFLNGYPYLCRATNISRTESVSCRSVSPQRRRGSWACNFSFPAARKSSPLGRGRVRIGSRGQWGFASPRAPGFGRADRPLCRWPPRLTSGASTSKTDLAAAHHDGPRFRAPNGLPDRVKLRSCERPEARGGRILDVFDRRATTDATQIRDFTTGGKPFGALVRYHFQFLWL